VRILSVGKQSKQCKHCGGKLPASAGKRSKEIKFPHAFLKHAGFLFRRHLQPDFLKGVLQSYHSDGAPVPDDRDAAQIVADHQLDGAGDLLADADAGFKRKVFGAGPDDGVDVA
jgi:hypothetical protein